ncbi:MAG: hypothetical protein IPL29_08920 [Propionivibrio sp.]|nr:hypothetical protein [Propionivibrio sp.]
MALWTLWDASGLRSGGHRFRQVFVDIRALSKRERRHIPRKKLEVLPGHVQTVLMTVFLTG